MSVVDDLPVEYHAVLRPLEIWSNDALKKQVFARLNQSILNRYDDLLALEASKTLTEVEHHELDELQYQAELLMFRKAYAALLLKRRGQQVPTLAELRAAAELQ